MSTRKRIGAKQPLFYQAWKRSRAAIKGLMAWLLRILFMAQRPARLAKAGFVLPTVVMVTLVVTLLTSAILARSFDRAQIASNYRVSEEVLNAALPALDRAQAKIDALFEDPNLPRGTPTDLAINDVLVRPKYTIGDETRLNLAYDFGDGTGTFGGDNNIQAFSSGDANSFENGENFTTAWRFPVDTDNNGLFDSFTLYSILFRSPNTDADGDFTRERNPLDARALPLDEGEVSGACAAAIGTSSSLVGTNGWIKASGQLKKSFFVYVATVPITNKDELGLPPEYEDYPGLNQGFSSLEYQQDVGRIPLSNNAVVYEDDLIATPGPTFRLNGRVVTNSNLALKRFGNPARFYQVSSKESCFYDPENAKIIVGGNYTYGGVDGNKNDNKFDVDLYNGEGNDPKTGELLNQNNPSVTQSTSFSLYNTQAYERRINTLVTLAIRANGDQNVTGAYPTQAVSSNDPREVRNGVENLINGPNRIDPVDARNRELDSYFRKRTRRVPFAEVGANAADSEVTGATTAILQGVKTDALRPPQDWIYPFDPMNGIDESGFAELELKKKDGGLLPKATEFDQQLITDQGKESFTGDRVLLGNNLPELLYNSASGQWVSEEEPQDIVGIKWNKPAEATPRQRKTRVRSLDDLGDISRDGFWETKAAEIPINELDNTGGLRIVTDAGVYLSAANNIADATASNIIWPDTMPVINGAETTATPSLTSTENIWLNNAFPVDKQGKTRPFLRMRGTVVYHYRHDDDNDKGTPAPPIACVDTYYDPTNATTAGRAANGTVYGPPNASVSSVRSYLDYQVSLRYPNGHQVNELLGEGLAKIDAGAEPTLAEQSAIDAAICSLQIYGKVSGNTTTWGDIGSATTTPTTGYTLPDGAIREVSFLDGRQIKAIDSPDPSDSTADDPTTVYDDRLFDVTADSLANLYTAIKNVGGLYRLPIEQRQPLEVRVTQISIDDLRKNRADTGNSANSDEYMLPNSGIIYASRNDALADDTEMGEARLSANDFALDPTRRANGVMLINGKRLARTDSSGKSNTFREVEKGLTLVSNLPVYMKGEFNPHTDASDKPQEEFQEPLKADYTNFYSRKDPKNKNFACRKGDSRLRGCTTPDEWRTGNILTDSVTLLSSGYVEGTRADGDFDLRNNQTDNFSDPDEDATDEISNASEVIRDRLSNGFWNNNYVTSRDFDDAKYSDDTGYTDTDDSSYFNNFVTPIQRRVAFPEYVMEICRKLPVSECEPDDWVVGYDLNGNGTLDDPVNDLVNYDVNRDGAIDRNDVEANIQANQLAAVLTNILGLDAFNNAEFDPQLLGAGTTTRTPLVIPDDQRYVRRIAFLRHSTLAPLLNITAPALNSTNATGNLVLDTNNKPFPIGISGTDDDTGDSNPQNGALAYYPYSATLTINSNNFAPYSSSIRPRLRGNTLWYRALNGSNVNYGYNYPLDYVNKTGSTAPPLTGSTPNEHPLLAPVLNIQYPKLSSGENITALTAPQSQNTVEETNWLQQPSAGTTIFNMVMATGDVPNRPPFKATSFNTDDGEHLGDYNGGLPNLPRFAENWDKNDAGAATKIRGSLIQLKRSEVATAPFFLLGETRGGGDYSTGGPFNYPQIYTQSAGGGRIPFFTPPSRDWGFDVGLLSQIPDLLAQQFLAKPAAPPNQFFREVGRGDEWIQTLLCAKASNDEGDEVNAINSDQRPTAFCEQKSNDLP